MDPRLTSMITESQYRRRRDDPERGYGAYRPPVERRWPHVAAMARRQVARLLLGAGQRLADEPLVSDAAATAVRPDVRAR